ncbi:TerB family tellurite resistance protein [Mucilaginibacter achroorhodeus]|uniref:TerB family tellurite resistance protein n=1 Tax=Mucilaginibacter achroorhodeus TaxID=2599294 RepID=A0A563U641_9SPHI|nr:TerB family tellurite resistance protein [Mucilaginibacter achroorhodeus]TWR26826.1 TerB family tellurite resistance protein [Mucilaginibacter achroorhodeus]
MKKQLKILGMALAFCILLPLAGRAQSVSDCIEQLILDYQKLAGMKSVLSEMYNGYSVLRQGYGVVNNASRGNFSLHQLFLDGLLVVSPAVRHYPRVADIISDQATLFWEYRAAAASFSSGGRFKPDELRYISAVYDHLADASFQNLDHLLMVMSDHKLRMSDAERLAAIDRIFVESRNQLSYLRRFNNEAKQTLRLRAQASKEKQTLNGLYGIKLQP